MKETIFRIASFSDDEMTIKTRSNRAVKFTVLEYPDEIFRYKVAVPALDLYVCGNTPMEILENLPEAVCKKYRNYVLGKKFVPRGVRRFIKAYEKRFEEVKD